MSATPQQLQHLATRMGLTAVLDASGGYDVVRVIVTNRQRAEVFDPANDAEQAMAVLCWLLTQNHMEMYDDCILFAFERRNCLNLFNEKHDNTPPSLRAAILAAAMRVAGET